MNEKREFLEGVIDHHTQSLDFDKRSVLYSVKLAVCGGGMAGVGTLGFVESVVFRIPELGITSAIVAGLGGLLIKDSIRDAEEHAGNIAEEQHTINVAQQELSSGQTD